MEIIQILPMLKSADLPLEASLKALRDEASLRRYYRVQFNNGHNDAILCDGLPRPYEDNDHFIKLAYFLSGRGIPVPEILARDPAAGRLLLSDVGSLELTDLLEDCESSGNLDLKWDLLRQAIDLMLALHRLDPPAVVQERIFDKEKFINEIDFLNNNLIALCDFLEVENPMSYECRMFLYELCAKLATRSELVFTHRDYHGRNLLLDKAGSGRRMSMVDFQDARMGLPFYDLASLLYDPYSNINRNERLRGLEYYLQNANPEIKKLKSYYYVQALQRILKALGTYVHQTFVRGHGIYLDSIGNALLRLDEIIQFGFFPDSTFIFVSRMRRDVLPLINVALGKGKAPP